MPESHESEILDIDVDDVIEAVRSRADGPVYSISEFDAEDFNVIHLAEVTYELYEDEAAMEEHFAEIHGYVNVDFTERDLFAEALFPMAERVDYLVTRMDYLTIVRIYDGQQGLFMALDPDEPVSPLAGIVLEAMGKQ